MNAKLLSQRFHLPVRPAHAWRQWSARGALARLRGRVRRALLRWPTAFPLP